MSILYGANLDKIADDMPLPQSHASHLLKYLLRFLMIAQTADKEAVIKTQILDLWVWAFHVNRSWTPCMRCDAVLRHAIWSNPRCDRNGYELHGIKPEG